MPEKEPSYIADLKRHIVDTVENHEPRYFRDFKVHIDNKIESEINDLAVMIKDNFATKYELQDIKDDIKELRAETTDIKNTMATKEDIKNMATKHDVKEILAHIGRYEIRAQNHEEILLQDHKPRIIDLEKKVFV